MTTMTTSHGHILERLSMIIDSLHTALLMQALGSIQAPKSLQTITFEIYGPGFWTPSRLRHLWEGYGGCHVCPLFARRCVIAIAECISFPAFV